MMEVINNFVATVYERVDIAADGRTLNIDEDNDQDPFSQQNYGSYRPAMDRGQMVKWKLKYRI